MFVANFKGGGLLKRLSLDIDWFVRLFLCKGRRSFQLRDVVFDWPGDSCRNQGVRCFISLNTCFTTVGTGFTSCHGYIPHVYVLAF